MEKPTRVPAIEGVCLPAGRRAELTVPLALVLLTVMMLVDRGADPALALGSLVVIIGAVARLVHG